MKEIAALAADQRQRHLAASRLLVCLGRSGQECAAALMTLVLKLPAQAAVAGDHNQQRPRPAADRRSAADASSSPRGVARLLKTRSISLAYGRLRTMRSCARRSFDDETIFMAFVICCVDLTARTRRRMSISDGICYAFAPADAMNCAANSFIAAFRSFLSASSSVFFSRIVVSSRRSARS